MSERDTSSDASRAEVKKNSTSILRFAGMGFQLAAAIGLGVVVGMKVDEHLMWEQPMGTALFGLFGLAAGMYQVLRALL
ncbi:MAG: AtpZ/AtpI family protein [Flavobacteriales bacterium]